MVYVLGITFVAKLAQDKSVSLFNRSDERLSKRLDAIEKQIFCQNTTLDISNIIPKIGSSMVGKYTIHISLCQLNWMSIAYKQMFMYEVNENIPANNTIVNN